MTTLEPIPEDEIIQLDEPGEDHPPPHVEAQVHVVNAPEQPRTEEEAEPDSAEQAPSQPTPEPRPTTTGRSTPSGRSTPTGRTNSKTHRKTPAEQREDLIREKIEIEKRRARQISDRAKRHKEREEQKRKAKADAELKRKQEALRIQEEAMRWRRLASSRIEFETTKGGGLPASSSESSFEEDEYEDLPGEVEFLVHFKKVRDYSPGREELVHQQCGDTRDSIRDVIHELEDLEQRLEDGSQLGDGVDELYSKYEHLNNRITHLCYTQGSYAKMRGLRRSEILLQLDIELKRRTEKLMQDYKKVIIEEKKKRKEDRNRKRLQRQRASSDPTHNMNTTETPYRRTHSLSDAQEIPAQTFGGEPNGGPQVQANNGPTTPRQAPLPRFIQNSSAPRTNNQAPGYNPGPTNNPSGPGMRYQRGPFNNNGTHPSGSANQPPPSGPSFGFPPGSANSTGSQFYGFNTAAGPVFATNPGYVPHYLKPQGEGALFYTTLPPPWNQVPEHEPTPLSQIPNLQKSGYFSDFDGTIQSYRSFSRSFIIAGHCLDIPITSKYLLLKGCLLKFHVLAELVNATHPSAEGYRTLILTLEERYGHVESLLSIHLQRLTDLPKIRETYIEDLEQLADVARGYDHARQANHMSINQDPIYFNLIKSKLTDRLRREYARYSREQNFPQGHCDVQALLRWLQVYVADPLRMEPPTKKKIQPHQKQGQVNPGPGAGSGFQPGPLNVEKAHQYFMAEGCPLCKMKHPIKDCPEFASTPLNKKYDILRSIKFCFKCIDGPHMSTQCKSTPVCTKCQGSHHTLLHYNKKPNDRSNGRPQSLSQFAAPCVER